MSCKSVHRRELYTWCYLMYVPCCCPSCPLGGHSGHLSIGSPVVPRVLRLVVSLPRSVVAVTGLQVHNISSSLGKVVLDLSLYISAHLFLFVHSVLFCRKYIMPKRKTAAKGVQLKKAKALLKDIVAEDVMPPCSHCLSAKETCRLVLGECVCVRCTSLGKGCDLFLTVEDGTYSVLVIPYLEAE